MIKQLKQLVQWIYGPRWICTPHEWEDDRGARCIVRSWTRAGARMKSYDYLHAENIVVRPYEE
jgi:hypothetical protein